MTITKLMLSNRTFKIKKLKLNFFEYIIKEDSHHQDLKHNHILKSNIGKIYIKRDSLYHQKNIPMQQNVRDPKII